MEGRDPRCTPFQEPYLWLHPGWLEYQELNCCRENHSVALSLIHALPKSRGHKGQDHKVLTASLTSIQEHQCCQHQERSCLPHELIEHTPKGGPNCKGRWEGITEAANLLPPTPEPPTGFLPFILSNIWGWPPHSIW